MGLYSWLRTRTDEKIERSTRPLLRDDEVVEIALLARTRVDARVYLSLAGIAVGLVLVMRMGWLPRTGGIVAPIAITLSSAIFIRTYYLVTTTANRLIILRLSRWTERRVDAHYALAVGDVRAELTHGQWNGTVLTVTARPFGQRLRVGPSFRERAAALARRLSGSPGGALLD